MTDLSIIIPAWKEAERIGKSLDKLSQYLSINDFGRVEVLVVVAESSDNTFEVARSKSLLFDDFKIIDAGPRIGKGRDIKICMGKANGAYKLFMDADLATPLYHLNTVYQAMSENIDVIIGVRDLTRIHKGLRKYVSIAGNLLVRKILGLEIEDTQCGFKAFRKTVADDLFSQQTILGWGFDIELLALVQYREYSFRQIQIKDWQDIKGGTFNKEIISGAISTFLELVKIKWNFTMDIYEKYGN